MNNVKVVPEARVILNHAAHIAAELVDSPKSVRPQVGKSITSEINGCIIKTKLWGFNVTRTRLVVEVCVNDNIKRKVQLTRSNRGFVPQDNISFGPKPDNKTGR